MPVFGIEDLVIERGCRLIPAIHRAFAPISGLKVTKDFSGADHLYIPDKTLEHPLGTRQGEGEAEPQWTTLVWLTSCRV